MNDQVTEQERVMPDTSSSTGKAALKPPILVQVVATRDWDVGVGFQLRWEFPKGVWNSGAMVFAKDDLDREINYDLVDETDLDLVFDSQADDCIWVTDGPCPKKVKPPHGSDKGQIKNKVRAGNKKLTLENANNTTYKLHYALRFTGKTYTNPDGVKFGPNYAYDPEYRNNGGGGNV